LLIILREGRHALLPTKSLNATGMMVRLIALTVMDASSAGSAAHTEETAVFSASCAALGEEAVAVEEESLPGVRAHSNGRGKQ
jgi:hypothetical protein